MQHASHRPLTALAAAPLDGIRAIDEQAARLAYTARTVSARVMHHPTISDKLSPSEIAEARYWLTDCEWADMTNEEIDELPDFAIVRAVRRHYCGGLDGFIEATGFRKPLEPGMMSVPGESATCAFCLRTSTRGDMTWWVEEGHPGAWACENETVCRVIASGDER